MNGTGHIRQRWLVGVSLAVTIASLTAFSVTASAHKIVGRDGTIHACYRVKGKPKGALRAVHGRAKCHRGERKIAWSARGSATQTGATGPAGSSGSDAAIAALSERVDALATRVEKLEKIVSAVCSQVALLTTLLPIEPFSCP